MSLNIDFDDQESPNSSKDDFHANNKNAENESGHDDEESDLELDELYDKTQAHKTSDGSNNVSSFFFVSSYFEKYNFKLNSGLNGLKFKSFFLFVF